MCSERVQFIVMMMMSKTVFTEEIKKIMNVHKHTDAQTQRDTGTQTDPCTLIFGRRFVRLFTYYIQFPERIVSRFENIITFSVREQSTAYSELMAAKGEQAGEKKKY